MPYISTETRGVECQLSVLPNISCVVSALAVRSYNLNHVVAKRYLTLH